MQVRRDTLPSGRYWPGRHSTETLALYEERLTSFQDRLVATLSSHTAHILLHRAIWHEVPRHPALHLIHNSDGSFCCEVLQKSYATPLEGEIALEAAWGDLVAEIRRILSRLLGRDMAEGICADTHL
jgi:hypothetical protein